MTKIAIIQSNYIPWKGYFDIIHDVDIFVFLDDVQMTKRDWRTRNKIKTPKGTDWVTVPIIGGRNQLICEAKIVPDNWQEKHQNSLINHYSQTEYFSDYSDLLDWLYKENHEYISKFNQETTALICNILNIETEFMNSKDLGIIGSKDDRLINICKSLGASVYLSGPAARDYIIPEKFHDAQIELQFKDYSGYPEYSQLFPPFTHEVTILDLLFNIGPDAASFIWGWRDQPSFT